MHFDSDETSIEDGNPPTHPLVSAIVFLDGDVGGPTLITDQTLRGGLASQGWLMHPRSNRLVAFDAKYLHGVIPGRGHKSAEKRRLSFMVGFWDKISAKSRGAGKSGPGQTVPMGEKNLEWVKEISFKPDDESASAPICSRTNAAPCTYVRPVWEPVQAEALSSPTYEQCYQGF